MTVFHVVKNTNYTVMSNHHLRNRELSLKAKGLLSQMLSLPEKWDYTLQGLAYINRGRLRGAEYTIYEEPQLSSDLPALEKPLSEKPLSENPTLDNPTQ